MTVIPFLMYKILPSQNIIKENIRFDHVQEDIDTLIYALAPILFITKTNVPKPPFLNPNVIEHLTDKPGTLNLLQLLGWLPNNRDEYVFVNANAPEEIRQRDEVANEFRQFYDELKKYKDNDISLLEYFHTMITTVPFSSYNIVPADKIIRNNVRIDQIKEDLDAMTQALTPVLYCTKTGVPKPPFLDPSIIQQLTHKPGTLDLLPLFGCTSNSRGQYSFVDANSPEETASREAAAIEFRQFYDEIKRTKNGNLTFMEYFLNHPNYSSSNKQVS